MGKGDKKTRRGKLFQGSFGVRRPKKSSRKAPPVPSPKIKVSATREAKPAKEMKEKEPIAVVPVKEAPEVVETPAAKEAAPAKTPKSTVAKKETKPRKSPPKTEHETKDKV